jgi:hypothetical protein
MGEFMAQLFPSRCHAASAEALNLTCVSREYRLSVSRMKKLLLCSVVVAFASMTAVQAGEACCSKTKAAACSKSTTAKASTQVKGAELLMVRR